MIDVVEAIRQRTQQLPHGWRWARLGDVAEYINGRAFKPEDWETSGLPIIRIQNLNSPKAAFNYYSKEVEPRYLVRDGDLLISWSASLDAFIWERGPAILNQHIFKVNEHVDIVRRDYLYFVAREAMTEIRSQVHGATMQHITRPEFEAIKIPVPPLAEQQRIAAILTKQMATVERARAAAEAQLAAAKELPAAYLRAVFESDEAHEWKMVRLKDITQLESGGTPSRGNTTSFKGRTPWVKTLDLNCATVYTTEECITETAVHEIRGEILPVGTVMVAMYGGAGTIGKSGILGIPATTNQAVCSILPNANVFSPSFLHSWLTWFRPHWMKYSGGNRKDPNINKGIVEQVQCPLPPLLRQVEVSTMLDKQMNAAASTIKVLEDQRNIINQLPAALLRQAFSGEL